MFLLTFFKLFTTHPTLYLLLFSIDRVTVSFSRMKKKQGIDLIQYREYVESDICK